jgi:large subunit ribosomal protein L10
MAKTKEQKKEILENLVKKIKQAKSIIFASFHGLGVKENEDLRKRLKEEKGEYYVVKKTLLNLTFKDSQIKDLNTRDFNGQVATVFGYEDEVIPAKIIGKFSREQKGKMDFLGGILEGSFISGEEAKALAMLPTKNELYAKLVGSVNAPVSGLVNALTGNLRNLVNTLKAIEEKKQG